jgi:hypothetical protein
MDAAEYPNGSIKAKVGTSVCPSVTFSTRSRNVSSNAPCSTWTWALGGSELLDSSHFEMPHAAPILLDEEVDEVDVPDPL